MDSDVDGYDVKVQMIIMKGQCKYFVTDCAIHHVSSVENIIFAFSFVVSFTCQPS